VERVAGREALVREKHVPGTLDVAKLDREDLVDDPEDRLEGGLDGVAAPDRRVPVEDLLQHLRVGDEPLAVGNAALEELPGVDLVRVIGAHQVHRHVRVDEDHASPSCR
jgi:hypothetical protein